MDYRLTLIGSHRVLIQSECTSPVKQEHDALDLIMLARRFRADYLVVRAQSLHHEFYRLDSGFAGAFLQKLMNYGIRIAVVGNIDEWLARSNAFREFVLESNSGKSVWFIATEQDLMRKLSA